MSRDKRHQANSQNALRSIGPGTRKGQAKRPEAGKPRGVLSISRGTARKRKERQCSPHAGHRDQLAEFLAAIDRKRPPRVDGREGRRSVEIICAIYQSARTGQVVRLPFIENGQ